MKKWKRILCALLLPALLIGLLAGCGSDAAKQTDDGGGQTPAAPKQDSDLLILTNQGAENPVLETPEKPLDAAEVYRSLTYIPEMFYGYYQLRGGETAWEAYQESVGFMRCQVGHD